MTVIVTAELSATTLSWQSPYSLLCVVSMLQVPELAVVAVIVAGVSENRRSRVRPRTGRRARARQLGDAGQDRRQGGRQGCEPVARSAPVEGSFGEGGEVFRRPRISPESQVKRLISSDFDRFGSPPVHLLAALRCGRVFVGLM
ncbi:hypothetical protein [Streptacidiphilus sp. PAMC 29251]